MRLTCIVPKFNGGKWFPASFASLLNQTQPFAQIIISDDNSTDGSLAATRDLAKLPNVSVITPLERLSGMGANISFALNRIESSEGYTLIASVDDLWHLNFAMTLQSILEREHGNHYNAVFCDRWVIDEAGKRKSVSASFSHPLRSRPEDWPYYARQCRFIIHGALFKTRMLLEVAPLLEQCGQSADWILIAEAARTGSLRYYPRPLFDYRIHADSTTATRRQGHRRSLEKYATYLQQKEASPVQLALLQTIVNSSDEFISGSRNSLIKDCFFRIKTWAKFLAVKAKLPILTRTLFP